MQLSTLADIKQKLEFDNDIFDGDFVDLTTELLGYINEAIADVQAQVHTLYQDYFLCYASLALVSGTKEYAIPSNCYAMKVRAILYDDGTNKYEILRIKRLLDTLYFDNANQATQRYKYIPVNMDNTSTSGSFKVRLYPTPAETNSNVTIWYIRNAKKLVNDSDVCDIPEFINYIYAHVKYNLAKKEKIQMDVETAKGQLVAQNNLMVDTLNEMIPDEGNDIRPDFEFYDNFDQHEFRS